jgi:hypothetical protein
VQRGHSVRVRDPARRNRETEAGDLPLRSRSGVVGSVVYLDE